MRLDVLSLFSDGQSVSSSGTSTNVLDIQGAGFSEVPAYVAIRCSTGSLTKAVLQGSENNSTWTDIGAGVESIPVPQGCPRYLRLSYTGTATVTAGITLATPSPVGKRIGDYAAN